MNEVSRDAGPSLRDRVIASSSRVVGAPERRQVLDLIRGADAYRVDDAAAASLALALERMPQNVERNLDMIRLPANGIWIEYADAPRRPGNVTPLPGARHPVDVGTLVCPDPDNDDRVVMMTAWDFDDAPVDPDDRGRRSVRHSYAAVAFSRTDVSHHAYEARHRYSGEEGRALERILSLMHAYVPEGLAAEMLLMSDVDERDPGAKAALEESVMRDVTSEAPFAMAALMLMSSRDAKVAAPVGEGESGTVPLSPPTQASRIIGRLFGRGFVMKGRPRAPSLGYRAP